MRFGLTMFCTDESALPAEVAAAAEEAGFGTLLFPDHTHTPSSRATPYPGGGSLPRCYSRIFDALLAAGSAIAATSTIRVGTGVCLVAERDPIILAREVATLDVLSSGRFVFGVGAGWDLEECANHGVDPAERWAVLRERVLAIRHIWGNDVAEFHSPHVDMAPLWSWPKPVQQPGPPVLVGGHGAGVLRRVVDYGDGWYAMPAPGSPPLAVRISELGRLAAEAGRPHLPTWVQLYGDRPDPRIIERYVQAGAEQIVLSIPSAPTREALAVVRRHGELVRRYAGPGG